MIVDRSEATVKDVDGERDGRLSIVWGGVRGRRTGGRKRRNARR